MINQLAVQITEQWLSANKLRLWHHVDCDCCSTRPLGCRDLDCPGGWISVTEAFEIGVLRIDDAGIRGGLGKGGLIPMEWDFGKIRKECQNHIQLMPRQDLIDMAVELGVNLI